MTPALRLRSDEHLVALFRAGREDAFEAIHDRHARRLHAVAARALRATAATPRAIVQEAFCAPTARCATTTGRWSSSRGCTGSCATSASTSCAGSRRRRRSRMATAPAPARTSSRRSAAGTSCAG